MKGLVLLIENGITDEQKPNIITNVLLKILDKKSFLSNANENQTRSLY